MKNNFFVDTNIFLRFLTRDEEKQYQAVKRLFSQAAKGKISLVTSALVVFELVWTLQSYYDETRESIVEKIIALLNHPNLEVEHRELLMESLIIWPQKNVEFNDCFNYVWAKNQQAKGIYSYDRHFDRLPRIPRLEPRANKTRRQTLKATTNLST